MEGKYGRLYTEAEMHRAAAYGATRALGLPIEKTQESLLLVAEANAAMHEAVKVIEREATFPVDEPLFLLRGQDKAAPETISMAERVPLGYEGPSDYTERCDEIGSPAEHIFAVRRAAREMRVWQAENPERVKVPD